MPTMITNIINDIQINSSKIKNIYQYFDEEKLNINNSNLIKYRNEFDKSQNNTVIEEKINVNIQTTVNNSENNNKIMLKENNNISEKLEYL